MLPTNAHILSAVKLHDRCTRLRHLSKQLRKDSDALRAYLRLLMARAKATSTPSADDPFRLF